MPARSKPAAVTPRRGTKLRIGFGLVNVEVKYAPLVPTGAGRTAAKTCCRTHMAPVKSEYRCTEGGELLEQADKVMAYEVDGRFVEVDTDTLGMEGDGRLELTAACDVAMIDPLYFDKPYVLWPTEGSEQGYDLLAAVLRETGRAVIGTTVAAKATRVMVLRWSTLTDTLLVHSCVYDERIAWQDVATVREATAARDDLPAQAVDVASTLLASLEADGFDFAAVSDEYAVQLDEAIQAAAAGVKPKAKKPAEPQPQAVDLMAALQASVQQAQDAKPKPRGKAKVAA